MYSSVHDLGSGPKAVKVTEKYSYEQLELGVSPWIEKENLCGCCCSFPSTKSSHSLSLPLTKEGKIPYRSYLKPPRDRRQ